jgi:hypothetical protein
MISPSHGLAIVAFAMVAFSNAGQNILPMLLLNAIQTAGHLPQFQAPEGSCRVPHRV